MIRSQKTTAVRWGSQIESGASSRTVDKRAPKGRNGLIFGTGLDNLVRPQQIGRVFKSANGKARVENSATKTGHKGKDHFMMELPNRMLMLAAAWEDFAKKSPQESGFMEELASVLIVADTLKELCEARGMNEIANLLRGVDAQLNNVPDTPMSGRDRIYQQIASNVSHLVSLAEQLIGEPQQKASAEPVAVLEQLPIPVAEPVFAPGSGESRHVFIVSKDEDFIGECSVQMGHYGYLAHSFQSYEAFTVGLTLGEPVAVIVDLDLVKEDKQTLGNAGAFKTNRGEAPVPMIVVGTQADFHSRLMAAKAGSAAFFAKPVNVSLLLDKLDAIINNAYVVEPFRILVVDDSETMIRFLKRSLNQAGMTVQVEMYPDKVLQAIGEFNPDLILMDMYMPLCDGQELSRIIRQYESYTSIPIVFLSSETDIKKQLAAMQIGADDFLTKPIDPEHLVTSITTRVQRHRILASYMVQDSLTGLLNHTKLKQRLEQTMEKAMRSKIPMAFAMVDIDHFKKVNDTYGHPMGDRVIKSLSRLLQKRLRKTDSIGRYGGEEFAVIFWDADVNAAAKILDDIRADFARIDHHHEGRMFSCSFSGGVAGFPEYPDAQAIGNAADKALYQAKRGGRNQVTIANE